MKKKTFWLLIVLTIAFSLALPASAYAYIGKTADDGARWVESLTQGASYEMDGFTGYYDDYGNWVYVAPQCVDIICGYMNYLTGTHTTGNACDYATNWLPEGYNRIGKYPGFVPQKGDILVWTTGPSGHVAIVTNVESSTRVIYSEQNTWEYPNALKHNSVMNPATNDYWGVIRPDFAPANRDPLGCFDGIESGNGTIRVTGWAFDPDCPDESISIHAYVGGNSASGEGHNLGKANKYREDVNKAYGISGNHGFDFTFHTDLTGNQPVYLYAIDSAGGNNPEIGSKTVVIGTPVGEVELAEGGNGTVRIKGWAYDPDDASNRMTLRVYVGGSSESGSNYYEISTNHLRSDVNSTYGITGNHGFDETIEVSEKGYKSVYIYAVDKVSGTLSLLKKVNSGEDHINVGIEYCTVDIIPSETDYSESKATISFCVDDSSTLTDGDFFWNIYRTEDSGVMCGTEGYIQFALNNKEFFSSDEELKFLNEKEGIWERDFALSLLPNTTYFYQMRFRGEWTELKSFKTASCDTTKLELGTTSNVFTLSPDQLQGFEFTAPTSGMYTFTVNTALPVYDFGIVSPDIPYYGGTDDFSQISGLLSEGQKTVVSLKSRNTTLNNLTITVDFSKDVVPKLDYNDTIELKHSNLAYGGGSSNFFMATCEELQSIFKSDNYCQYIHYSLLGECKSNLYDKWIIHFCDSDDLGESFFVYVCDSMNRAGSRVTYGSPRTILDSINCGDNTIESKKCYSFVADADGYYSFKAEKGEDSIFHFEKSSMTEDGNSFDTYLNKDDVLILRCDSTSASCNLNVSFKSKYIDSGTCGDNLTWTLDEKGTLTISGTGEMYDYKYKGTPWYLSSSSIKSVKIESSVTGIGNYSFDFCTGLTDITIPSSVTSIGAKAFNDCSGLTDVYYGGTEAQWNTLKSSIGDCNEPLLNAAVHYTEHTHTFAEEWSHDDTHHWHAATCGHTSEVSGKAVHIWDKGVVTKEATLAEEGVKTFTCTVCGRTKTETLEKIDGTLTIADFEAKGLSAGQTLYADGEPATIDENGRITLSNGDAKTLSAYSVNDGNETDVHKMYPTNMKVWMIERNQDGSATAKYVEEFDGLLQYSGSSIRITGKKGIRMITSVPNSTRESLKKGALQGYTLEEYGTLLAWNKDLGSSALTLDNPIVKSNYAYRKGVADPVFKSTDSLTQYTNVLTFDDIGKCVDDLAMRPYMKLSKGGETITIYGGIVVRNIGYIAWQNRNAFAEGTEAYNYIWDIINYVYPEGYKAA